MLLTILIAIAGIAMVMLGAQGLTEGASAMARRLSVPPIVVGLTVVAMGTSAPEFFISLTSQLKGTTDMAVGNVVGSNIFNSLLIVGVAALAAPMILSKTTVLREIPVGMGATLLLFVLAYDRVISRWDAVLLFVAFLAFMVYTVRKALRSRKHALTTETAEEDAKAVRPMAWWKAAVYVLVGLAGLILGSDLFVDAAVKIARALAVNDAVIGLTIVAGGTSLPELATSVVAARHGQSEIAIGNVIGSNVFNILMILGITGLVAPLPLYEITMVDLAVLFGSALLIWIFSYTRFTIERWEGGVLTACFVAYMSYLLCNL
ncbi:MAG: calcium/sodium antiporter [Bacteroidaceae bacterium]|nr:calcium/sodium antiporter [Bacteroidaceae bacterium]